MNPTSRRWLSILAGSGVLFAASLAMIAVCLFINIVAGDRFVFDGDETIYARVIERFSGPITWDLLADYGGEPASPAPLFFIVYAWVGGLFGYSFPVYRFISVAATLAAVWIVHLYATGEPKGAPAAAAVTPAEPIGSQQRYFPLLLLLFPYVFTVAFSAMAEPLTLLLTVIGLCAYSRGLERDSDKSFLFGSIAITAALHVRIHALFAPVALGAVLLLRRERSIRRWLIVLFPIAARIPLIVLQGGITVDREAFTGPKPMLAVAPTHLSFFLVWLGLYFFPMMWWLRGSLRINLVGCLLFVPFYLLFPPDFVGEAHRGAVRNALMRVDAIWPYAHWALMPYGIMGSYMATDLAQRIVRPATLRNAFFAACVLAFGASLVFSSVAFERYYQLAVVPLVMLGLTGRGRKHAEATILVCHALFLILTIIRTGRMIP